MGEALIARRGAQLDPHLGQLAHHFALAAPVDRPERAVDFALAAGRRADRLLAWEEAAGHYRAALRARELAGAGEDRMHCELLLVLGASQERAGSGDAKTTFAAAAATARALGDAGLLGRAALGYAGRWSQLGRVEEDVAALLQDALAGLGDAEVPLRARLLARLALELYYAGDPERRLALSDEAVELARRLGDPQTLAICLDARHYALWRPETVHERLEVASELRRIAETVGDPELELEGAGWTVVDLLELGDIEGADIQIAAASRLAEALHRPLYEWWTSQFRCARAQIDGRFDEAERLAEETLAIGRRGQAENATHVYAQSMFNVRREQGRLVEVEEGVRGMIGLYPAVPAWRCSLALLQLELGPGGGRRGGVRDGRRGRLRHAPARRELADRDHAAGGGLRPAGRRRPRRRAVRGAGALRRAQRARRAAARPATARRPATWARSPRRSATGRARRTTSPRRSRCTRRWARARSSRARSSRGRRWSSRAGTPARRAGGSPRRS